MEPTPTPPRRYRWRAVDAVETYKGYTIYVAIYPCRNLLKLDSFARKTWSQTYQLIKCVTIFIRRVLMLLLSSIPWADNIHSSRDKFVCFHCIYWTSLRKNLLTIGLADTGFCLLIYHMDSLSEVLRTAGVHKQTPDVQENTYNLVFSSLYWVGSQRTHVMHAIKSVN